MPSAKSDTTKTNRVTNVQVPGEPASIPEVKPEVDTAGTLHADDNPSTGKSEDAATDSAAAGQPPMTAEDAEALRAENEELRAQIAAAGRVKAANVGAAELPKAPSRHNYLSMNASDVDPNTLTKSVLTKDGWVCPPKIAQAKQ